MSTHGSNEVGFLLVDGYDLLGVATAVTDGGVEEMTTERHTLGDSFHRHASVGIAKSALGQDGFYDDATASSHDALVASNGVSRVFTYALTGNLVGSIFVGFKAAIQSKFARVTNVAKLVMAKAEYMVSGEREEGSVLHPYGSETATSGNTQTTPVDAANEFVGLLRGAITSNSVANPTVITTPVAHGLTTGDKVLISGVTGSTPTINAEYTVTVIDATHFSVPVNVTVGGTGGTWVQTLNQTGATGYAQCSECTFTTLTLKVRHSVDNVTYADLITFSNFTSGAPRGGQRVRAEGTVNRYTASSWSTTGAGTAKFMVGVARGKQ